MIKVSVIITNYNYEKFLSRCINSVINQNLNSSDYEIIVIDDDSKDNSIEIIKQYSKFDNFKIIKNKKNLGVAASANKAIRKAQGKYFVRLDADDYVSKDFLRIMTLYLESNPKILALACDYILVQNNDKVRVVSSENFPISCGIMYNREKFLRYGAYNKNFKHREEEELRIRFGKKYNLEYLKIPLYRYRMHKNNKTLNKDYTNKFRSKINLMSANDINIKFDKKNNSLLENVIAIIPARSNSKRLKNKNIYPIWKKPMIYWAIEAAKKSKFIKSVYVSSESEKILKIIKKYKARPIKRPKYLSKDNVFKIDVIRHAYEHISSKLKNKPSLIVSLQANSPEVVHQDLDYAINHLIKYNLNEVSSINSENIQNAAFRVMKKQALFQKSLSTYFGVVKTDIVDIHNKKDLLRLKNKKNAL